MSNATAANVSDLFRQAVETFQDAIRSGVKIQEDSAKRFTEVLRGLGSPLDWQKNTQLMVNEAIAATQRNMDESIRLMNHNAQTAMGLLQKAFEIRTNGAAPGEAAAEGAASSDEMWETALGAMRTNTQVILQANARVLESWAQLAQEITGRMQQAVQSGTKA